MISKSCTFLNVKKFSPWRIVCQLVFAIIFLLNYMFSLTTLVYQSRLNVPLKPFALWWYFYSREIFIALFSEHLFFFVESIKTRTWSFPCAYKISKCPYIIRYCRTRQEVKTSHCGYVYTSFQYKANRTFNRMKQNPLSMTKREVWTYIRGNRQRPVKRALKINRHRKSYKIFALRQ